MIYLNIVAEGPTEEGFIKDVLTPHLAQFEVYVSCQLTHTGGTKTHPTKGGVGTIPKYKTIRKALERWIEADKERADVYYTTMVDLYAFPKDKGSPYTQEIQSEEDKYRRVDKLEKAMEEDLEHDRFIAYVQLHEFETLVLVNPDPLKSLFPKHKTHVDRLKKEVTGQNVELINDSKENAPSKRIIRHISAYENQKVTIGSMVAHDIGLPVLRKHCWHFDQWLTRLEDLA